MKMDSIKGSDNEKIFTHTWIRNYCSKIPPYIYLQGGFLFIHFANKQTRFRFTNFLRLLYINIIIYGFIHLTEVTPHAYQVKSLISPQNEKNEPDFYE